MKKQTHHTSKPLFVLKPDMASALLGRVIGFFIILVPLFFIFVLGVFTGVGFVFGFFILFILVTMGIPLVFSYLDIRRREYRFYSDKLEYYDGWVVRNRHVVPYRKVTDITMQETLWNRFFNTATVKLVTAAGAFGSVAIPHLKDSEKVYQYLQKEILKLK